MQEKTITLLKSSIARAGGAEKYTWRIAGALKEKNYTITLLTSGTPIPSTRGVRTHYCPVTSPFSFRFVKHFDQFCENYIKENPTDVVFGLDRNRFQTHIRASNGVHAAYLQHRKETDSHFKRLSHSINPLHRALLQIEKESFENPRLKSLITNSQMVKEEILKHYQVDSKIIHVVHNGVEWEEMGSDFSRWPEEKAKMAKKLDLDPSLFQFLFIGHNYQRKGLEQLLKGLSLLNRRDFHLSVVGKEKNSDAFKKMVNDLNLKNQVSFFGSRSDIRNFYQLADALVIPSFYDPFANVTVEALAMGLFVVSSKNNGGHEILTAENGSVIEQLTDVDAMKDSLQKALERPKTRECAEKIRASCSHLDFSNQLPTLLSYL